MFNKFKKSFKRQTQSTRDPNHISNPTLNLDDENTLQSLGAVGGSITQSPTLDILNGIEPIPVYTNTSRELSNRELPPIPIQNTFSSIFNQKDTSKILFDEDQEVDPVREAQLRNLIEKHIPYNFEKNKYKLSKYSLTNTLYQPNYYFEIPRNDKEFQDIKLYYNIYKPEEEKKLKKLPYNKSIYNDFGYLYIELVEKLYQKYNFSDMELTRFLNE